MAPLPRFRVPAMQELHRQVRFANRQTLLRLIESAERAASEIDADGVYTEKQLSRLLTGFTGAGSDDELTPGAAVIRDLSTLVERLCHDTGYALDEAPDGALTTTDLMERWSVSRKTVERYRTQGLIARRVASGAGRAELRFTVSVVSRFEEARAASVERAAKFERIGDDERARMIHRARRYKRLLRCSLNQSAERLAKRFGRSHEGVRQVLRRHDEEQRAQAHGAPIFAEVIRRDVRMRFDVLEGARRGEEPAKLSKLLGPTNATRRQVTHMINTTRARLLRRLALDAPTVPLFGHADARSVILAPPAVRERLFDPNATIDLAAARATKPLTAEQERTASNAMLYLLHCARAEIEELATSTPSATALDRIETDLRWARMLRAQLIVSQLGVALKSLEATTPLTTIPADLIVAIGRVVDRHAPFHGGRLAAATAVAINRYTAGHRRAASSRAVATVRDIPVERLAPSTTWAIWLLPPPWLTRFLDAAGDAEAHIITRRYGLDGAAPATREELATEFGGTSQQMARLERAASRAAHAAAQAAESRSL
ncbi:MAG: hypothetical protein CMJ31_14560 [Phycisphaerae bacterium]|nr:hypothetical protein [Phycisphaerae bacterium]